MKLFSDTKVIFLLKAGFCFPGKQSGVVDNFGFWLITFGWIFQPVDNKEPKNICIESAGIQQIKNCKQFIYLDGTLKKEGDHTLLPNAEHLKLDLKKEVSFTLPSESLVVYTSFEY